MPSHEHFVFRSDQDNPSGLLRDFKGFTAKKIIKAIEKKQKRIISYDNAPFSGMTWFEKKWF
ncbi:hypothetical protein [Cellulophaga sp. Asnod2-G02]|uniref:hypothetical protein n=1 Tax=Cellulophaga sp. Asnod2-G02 TaxID=3160572 RepID=UPI00386878C1